MTSTEYKRTRKGGNPDSGGLVRKYFGWALFGAFGIGVAVGIALVAGQLASQPVGITGEPVSATESLASPRERGVSRPGTVDRKKKRNAQGQEAVPGSVPAAALGTVGTAPSESSSGSAYSGNPGSSAGSGGSGSSTSGGSGSSGSGYDYEDGEDSGYEYGDDSDEDGDDDYEDDD